MSKTLELAFKTNLNKTAKLQFPQVNVAVSEADAKAAMDNIIKQYSTTYSWHTY